MDRHNMTVEEETVFVEKEFLKYEKVGFNSKFNSIYSDYKNKIGESFKVLSRATEKDIDLENLPQWNIQFKDGTIINSYPEEICK